MNKTKTPRAKSIGLTNRLDFETTVDRISWLQAELATLKAVREQAVLRALETNAGSIQLAEEELKAKLALCEKFASEHRDELMPGKAKSNETPLSRYGFRTGNRTLKTLAKWTWEKVLQALLDEDMDVEDLVRTKHEVDKEAILRAAEDDATLVFPIEDRDPLKYPLSQFGLKIVQTESFYIEAKTDDAEPAKKEAV